VDVCEDRQLDLRTSAVRLCASAGAFHGAQIAVRYRGQPGDLIRAGVMTQELALPGRKGVARRDALGRKVIRYSPNRSGQICIRYALMDRGTILDLPFVTDPLAWVYRLLPMTDERRTELEEEAACEPLSEWRSR
jgi:hypothetical protein